MPWAIHESFDDRLLLVEQFDSMRRWIETLTARLGADGLLVPSQQFGDWLDPDAPAERPSEAKTDSEFIANAFFVRSLRVAARTARLLDDQVRATAYDLQAGGLAERVWARWREHLATTQTGCALAIESDLATDAELAVLADTLARLVRGSGGRVATGFLGTPLVLPALSRFGFHDEAYRMLLRHEMPSWLYQVDQGATTIWERWDAIRPDGSIHPGGAPGTDGSVPAEDHMLSFNHYAYGAVIDWAYRHLAGLAPDADQPGYRRVVVAPRPPAGISWVTAGIDTAYGRVGIDWRIDPDGSFVAELEIPFGASAELSPPTTTASRVVVDGIGTTASGRLGPGRHSVVVTEPLIAGG